jgi:hypothetical protein
VRWREFRRIQYFDGKLKLGDGFPDSLATAIDSPIVGHDYCLLREFCERGGPMNNLEYAVLVSTQLDERTLRNKNVTPSAGLATLKKPRRRSTRHFIGQHKPPIDDDESTRHVGTVDGDLPPDDAPAIMWTCVS